MPTSFVGIVFLVAWVYAIVDVISTESSLMRNIENKMVWLMIVIFLGPIGALIWFLAGRPRGVGLKPGDTTTRPTMQHPGGQPRITGGQRRPEMPPPAPPVNDQDWERERAAFLESWEAEKRAKEQASEPDEDDPPKA